MYPVPFNPHLHKVAVNPYVVGGLGGAGLGLGSGLLWYYLTDQAKRNALTQILLPTLGGAGLGLGAAGLYDYFSSPPVPPPDSLPKPSPESAFLDTAANVAFPDNPMEGISVTPTATLPNNMFIPKKLHDEYELFKWVSDQGRQHSTLYGRLARALLEQGVPPSEVLSRLQRLKETSLPGMVGFSAHDLPDIGLSVDVPLNFPGMANWARELGLARYLVKE